MNKKYILFGAGRYGQELLQWFGHDAVAFFCDNGNRSDSVEGVEVISYEKLKEMQADYHVVLAVTRKEWIAEISSQLMTDGISFSYFEDAAKRHIGEVERSIYESMNQRPSFRCDSTCTKFCIEDRFSDTGSVNSYFGQDLWAAKHIFEKSLSVITI